MRIMIVGSLFSVPVTILSAQFSADVTPAGIVSIFLLPVFLVPIVGYGIGLMRQLHTNRPPTETGVDDGRAWDEGSGADRRSASNVDVGANARSPSDVQTHADWDESADASLPAFGSTRVLVDGVKGVSIGAFYVAAVVVLVFFPTVVLVTLTGLQALQAWGVLVGFIVVTVLGQASLIRYVSTGRLLAAINPLRLRGVLGDDTFLRAYAYSLVAGAVVHANPFSVAITTQFTPYLLLVQAGLGFYTILVLAHLLSQAMDGLSLDTEPASAVVSQADGRDPVGP